MYLNSRSKKKVKRKRKKKRERPCRKLLQRLGRDPEIQFQYFLVPEFNFKLFTITTLYTG